MKISINSKFIEGPYGGGEKFSKYLRDFLTEKGETVVNSLEDDDIDLILHVNPFPFLTKASAYSFFDAYEYKIKHPSTVIVQRINECDERKNTKYMNDLLRVASNYSDYVVYIASWLKPLIKAKKACQVILNGADQSIFNHDGKNFWDGRGKMKIVTHHWGNNYMKGHDIYQKIDKLLNNKYFKELFEFTFIGNYPSDLTYKNTKMIEPLTDKELAKELRKHHLYITASRNEPAGMHHIEGALCGLPILYMNSGALPEYCKGFGIEFNETNLEEKLLEMRKKYRDYVKKIIKYDHTAKKMAEEYNSLFKKLYKNRGLYRIQTTKKSISLFKIKIISKLFSLRWKIKKHLK